MSDMVAARPGPELAETKSAGGPHVTLLKPARSWVSLDLGELWRYRGLLYFLAWRDIKVRYKQTALGVAWAVLQPLAMMAVLSLFLGRLAGMAGDGAPYPLFVLSGLLPWTYFAHGVTESTNSLVTNANLLSKVYFPRLVLPIAVALAGLVDFAIGLVLAVPVLAWYGQISWTLLLLPLFVGLVMLNVLAIGVWLSAVGVQFRDVRYAVPFLVQIWLFATPVAYPMSTVPAELRAVYGLNPLAGVVEGFRWSLLGGAPPSMSLLSSSALIAALLLIGGAYYFRRTEQTFADVA